ncbi:MAG: Methylated-DNA--protein-cysteine methyltransferase, partial [uncultured Thermoleophilia bacterium]
ERSAGDGPPGRRPVAARGRRCRGRAAPGAAGGRRGTPGCGLRHGRLAARAAAARSHGARRGAARVRHGRTRGRARAARPPRLTAGARGADAARSGPTAAGGVLRRPTAGVRRPARPAPRGRVPPPGARGHGGRALRRSDDLHRRRGSGGQPARRPGGRDGPGGQPAGRLRALPPGAPGERCPRRLRGRAGAQAVAARARGGRGAHGVAQRRGRHGQV